MGKLSYKLSCRLKSYSPEDKKRYSWDDRGMCRLFSELYKGTLRFNATAKEWYRWDGKRWAKDEGGMYAQKQAKIFAEALVIYSAGIKSEDTRSEFLKFVSRYGQYRNRKTLVDDARSEEESQTPTLTATIISTTARMGSLTLKPLSYSRMIQSTCCQR